MSSVHTLAMPFKVDRRYGIELPQGLLNGRRKDLPDGLFVLELYLRLRRVDIDVNIRRPNNFGPYNTQQEGRICFFV